MLTMVNTSTVYAFLWGCIFILALVIEVIVPGLISVWFAVGAVPAMIAAMLGASFPVQLAIFLLTSVGTLVITRPLAEKFVNSRTQPTNADVLIGKMGVVTEEINTVIGTGRIKVCGQDWAARPSQEGSIIRVGENVSVIRIEGSKLCVDKLNFHDDDDDE